MNPRFPEQEKKEIGEKRKIAHHLHFRLRLTLKRGSLECWKGRFSDFHQVSFFLGLESKSISLAYSYFLKTKTCIFLTSH